MTVWLLSNIFGQSADILVQPLQTSDALKGMGPRALARKQAFSLNEFLYPERWSRQRFFDLLGRNILSRMFTRYLGQASRCERR
jgi:hypothetical protein